jgi:thiol-disulfide isomerase/thioredoxin
MKKNFFIDNILWILILVIIIIIIYFIFSSDCNDNNDNNNDDADIIRKKINKKYSKSKKIYISPEIKNKPIKSMINKLTKKLNKISEGFDNNKRYKYIIKLFYADWCPHCVDFKPIWSSLKKKYSNDIKFIDVDCTNNNPNLPFINGFPTIALFNSNDKYIESYQNDRSMETFESYIKNKIL